MPGRYSCFFGRSRLAVLLGDFSRKEPDKICHPRFVYRDSAFRCIADHATGSEFFVEIIGDPSCGGDGGLDRDTGVFFTANISYQ